jgi:hypothetical protein
MCGYKRPAAGERLHHHDAEREYVGALIHFFTTLVRRYITEDFHYGFWRRESLGMRGIKLADPGEPKSKTLTCSRRNVLARHQHIRRLGVTNE